jgi:hypothetical protein
MGSRKTGVRIHVDGRSATPGFDTATREKCASAFLRFPMQEIEPEASRLPRRSGPGQPTLSARRGYGNRPVVLSFAIRHAQRPTRRAPWLAAADRLRGISSVDAANAVALEPLVEVQLPASALPVPDREETQLLAGQRVTIVELSDGTVQARHAGKRVPLIRWARTCGSAPHDSCATGGARRSALRRCAYVERGPGEVRAAAQRRRRQRGG